MFNSALQSGQNRAQIQKLPIAQAILGLIQRAAATSGLLSFAPQERSGNYAKMVKRQGPEER